MSNIKEVYGTCYECMGPITNKAKRNVPVDVANKAYELMREHKESLLGKDRREWARETLPLLEWLAKHKKY